MLQDFMNDAIGDKGGDDLGGFSFAEQPATLASSLIESIVMDVEVYIDVTFGLDLNLLFNSTAPAAERFPSPFLQINQLDLTGTFGINEWSAKLDLVGKACRMRLSILSYSWMLLLIICSICFQKFRLPICSNGGYCSRSSRNQHS